MRNVRWIALLLVLLQLVLLLGACGGEEGKTTAAPNATTGRAPVGTTAGKTEDNTTTAPKGEVTTPKTDDVPDDGDEEDSYLYLVVDGEAQYEIINPLEISSANMARVYEFMDELQERTGVSFRHSVETSQPNSEREILVCAYANRPRAAALGKQVSYTGYRIDVVGETIVLSTHTEYLEKMLTMLLDSLEELEDGTWVIDRYSIETERDLYANRTIPVYETENGRVAGSGIYYNAYDGYTVAIEKTNAEEFAAYLSKLAELGYTRYDENSIGMVDFYTYVKGNATLYVQYNTADKTDGPMARMTLTYDEWLPPTEEVTEYQTLADASINYLALAPGAGGSGLSMIFQLPDGSFLFVDGGIYTAADQAIILKFLKDNKPAQHARPLISCWFWTHPHGDHVWMATEVLKSWNTQVDVEMFAYNFIDPEVFAGTEIYDEFGPKVIDAAQKSYPDAIHWIMHAGQRLYFADTVIECIWSHEEVWPMKMAHVNDTNIAFSITIDGIKSMMLGDCQAPNDKMIAQYKETMRSLVVQNAHHTFNGPTLMYEYINPLYSFWSCDRSQMNTRANVFDHAKWLLTTKWTRIDADGNEISGARENYHNEVTTRLYIKDLKKQTAGWH